MAASLPPIVFVLLVFCGVLVALIVFLFLRSRARVANVRSDRIKLPGAQPSNETRNLPSWVWRVPFTVSGTSVTICAIIPILYPVNFFNYANATLQVFLSYACIYASIVAYGAFCCVRRSESEELVPSPTPSPFFYAFIVPNYKEDEAVLEATLAHLAEHPYAARQFIAVLAMEEREEGARDKAQRLLNKFRSQFYDVSYSLHELTKGVECPGKASNATAAGIVLSSLCRQKRISAALVNVTVMDADTLISPRYQLRLDQMLSAWHAAGETTQITKQIFTPYMSFSNVDDPTISLVIAATDLTWGMTQMFHITRRTPIRFAVSTYSLSLELLQGTGYWEVGDAGIGEDTHEALKVFFATDGEARTVPIYETFRCQCLHSDGGFIQSCKQRYKQAARHALGHIDMGYTLYKCWTCTTIPIRLRFVTLLQTFEIVYWMMGVMLGWGAALSTAIWMSATHFFNPNFCNTGGTLERVACYHDVEKATMDPVQQVVSAVFAVVWILVTLLQMSSSEFLSAHLLSRTPAQWRRAVLKWLTAPIVFILLFVLPAVESHWKLFKKEKLTYAVAPKSANTTPGSSCSDLEALGNRSPFKGGALSPSSPLGGRKNGGGIGARVALI